MEIQYTHDNQIQGIVVKKTDENFNESIIDLIEIINDHEYYTCYKVGEKFLVGKQNTKDTICIDIECVKSFLITNNAIIIYTDQYMFEISNNESRFFIY